MAEYPGFLHGAYGEINAVDSQNAQRNRRIKQAFVYIGTAPVHQIEGGAANVNKPILVNNIAEARAKLGYSDAWENYTLCEAMHAHFEKNTVGPLVFINVFNPATHKAASDTTVSLTPENGSVKIVNAENVILDTLTVAAGETEKTKGTDYTAKYDFVSKCVIISEVTSGSLGTSALTISYRAADPSAVTDSDVIGTTDNHGTNTGIYAVRNVFPMTGLIPAFILAPGFSSVPAIHAVMAECSLAIGKHWNAWMFVDMPLVSSGSTAITLQTAPTWKTQNGYTKDNESVFFPMATGTDGKKYHLSVLYAANFQELYIQNEGVPYMTASNTEIQIQDLYFGDAVTNRVCDDEIINRCLNANGINSAAFCGGHWVIWGMQAASYNHETGDAINVFDTVRMMLYYLTNDFQYRRNANIDKPVTLNTLKTIVSEEQARLDALIGAGALLYGKATVEALRIDGSDIYSGDFRIRFEVTTSPLMKSITGTAVWTDAGFVLLAASAQESA